jgi:phosphohistidine phosphatase
VILSSPLTRARQTADIIADAYTPRPPIVIVDALSPDGTQAAVVAEIEKHAGDGRIALVGHEPGLGELASRLVALRHPLEFKKGAVARIDLDAGSPAARGRLRWLLPPKVLRALGRRAAG